MRYFIPLFILVVLGTGCVPAAQEPAPEAQDNEVTVPTENDMTGGTATVESCPVGMVRFTHSENGLTFCYPEQYYAYESNQFVFINDPESNTIIQELKFTTIDENTDPKIAVMAYAAKPAGISCEVYETNWQHGTVYGILGYPTGDPNGQGLDTVDACRQSDLYQNALTNLILENFFVPDGRSDVMILVNGQQFPVFEEMTDSYYDSIDVK